jgi:hypothetical protein
LQVQVFGPCLLRRALARPVFLLDVRGTLQRNSGKPRRRDPVYWLVSAVADDHGDWRLSLPLAELLASAWQRWEVELLHRELKSGFGLGEQQAWTPVAVGLAIQWVVWVYACRVLAGFLAWGLGAAGRWAALVAGPAVDGPRSPSRCGGICGAWSSSRLPRFGSGCHPTPPQWRSIRCRCRHPH